MGEGLHTVEAGEDSITVDGKKITITRKQRLPNFHGEKSVWT